jgi:sulfur-oxidizing protein SoxZ
MKVKAKLKNGIVSVKAMAKHDMTTFNMMEKKTGNREDANFIVHMTGTVNGETVLDMSTSQFLSKNPIFKFKFKADGMKAGDKLMMSWVDRKGGKGKGTGKIK